MLNVAVIGLGWWGTQVARVLKDARSLRIAYGVDIAAPARQTWAGKHGLPTKPTYDEALADGAIDGVILCTPNTIHEEQVLAAAAAGKQVFCEKPFTLDAAGALRMIRACQDKGLIIGLGHERRFEPAMQEIKSIVDAGRLGEILQVEATFSHDKLAGLPADSWRGDPVESPAGGWTGMAVHLSDLLISFIGEASEVTARSAGKALAFPTGDTVGAQIVFANGAIGSIASTHATPFYARLAIYGSKGWVEARETAHPESPDVTYLHSTYSGEARQSVASFEPRDSIAPNFEEWAEAAAGNGSYRFTSEQIFANVALLEAVTKSCKTGLPEPVMSYRDTAKH